MKKYRGVFLKNEREIGLLREANRMVAMILDELGRQVRPGLPTMHFEEIVQNMCREFKVKPAFQGMYGFPYGLCCSVNEVCLLYTSTGRARAGSNRSPVWRGGAILFGPQPRKYDFKVNKKIRKLALRMALSSRLAGDNLLVVKGFDLPEAKTKVFAKIAGNLGLSKALIIAPEESRNLVLSSRNLPGITLTTPDQLSVYEILKHKQLVLLEGAVEPVETRLK